ncbi:thermonuclease family protein [Desulfovibrio aminophilus]|uniref:thermonuclease family protein n=1 Tax=Desulfovibrio aminophilus TaxID=81425 RepID=UPI003392FF2F
MKPLTLALLVLAALVLAHPSEGLAWTGRVVEAASGQALLVRAQDGSDVLVRLYGIEAPGPAEKAGRASRETLDDMARDREVDVLPLAGSGSRVDGHVILDLQDLSSEMVRLGMAWVDWRHCAKGVCERWLLQEQEARAAGLGYWRDHPLGKSAGRGVF